MAECIPFTVPRTRGAGLLYVRHAIERGGLAGGGAFGFRCALWLEAALAPHAIAV
jgi:hypothetical protein